MRSYIQFFSIVLLTKLTQVNKKNPIIISSILSCLLVFSSVSAEVMSPPTSLEISLTDRSETDLRKVYHSAPENPKFIIAYADLLLTANKFTEAKTVLFSSFENNDDEFERLMLLGKMSLSEKDITSAINYLFRAKELNNNEKVKKALAHLASIENKMKQEILLNKELLTSIPST